MSLGNILTRSWFSAVLATTVFFLIYQILIVVDQKYNSHPLCPFDDKLYPPWYWYTNYSVCGAFGITCLMLLLKLSQSEREIMKAPYLATLCIVILGLIATLLSLSWNWGGICFDMFGVASPAAIWGEWMSCGPLLLFISISLVDHSFLTRNDIIVIVSFFTSIALGFVIIIKQPIWLASIWLAISVIAYLPTFWLGVVTNNNQNRNTDMKTDEFQLFSELTAKKNNLCATLIMSLPLFIIVYLLALFGLINAPMTITCYQILSVLTKGLFAAAAMDAHLELLNSSMRADIEEKRANEARRAFLRLIFHKVRTPLNSLTMGIEILGRCDRLVESEVESLLMMKDASLFMTDTLDDMFTMQKIEDGKLELELNDFSVKDTITKVCCTLNNSATIKGIQFVNNISPDIPDQLIGDRCRIEHVYFILLGNAIKSSPPHTKIYTRVTCQPSPILPEDVFQLFVSVSDQGPSIPIEIQKTLFINSMQMKTNKLPSSQQLSSSSLSQDSDSRIGLGLCQQLITLHGGTLQCFSEVGIGSTFTFIIPLQLSLSQNNHDNDNNSNYTKNNSTFVISGNDSDSSSSSNNTNTNTNTNNNNDNNNISINEIDQCNSRIEEELLEEISNINRLKASCLTTGKNSPSTTQIRNILHNGSSTSFVNLQQPQLLQQEQDQGEGHQTIHNKYTVNNNNNNNVTSNNYTNTTTTCNINNDTQTTQLAFRGPVLVVDDVKSNRKMLSILLGKSGVISGMAEDGDEAVEMIRRDILHYRMVFMDNMMPRMNGVEAAKNLRKIGYQGLIIGITGNVLEEDVAQYLEGGADMILGKPLKMSELDKILRYVEENGCLTVSRMKLVESSGRLSWVLK